MVAVVDKHYIWSLSLTYESLVAGFIENIFICR